ncbi:MAG TPA: FtsK/SpoIIIE domain-containing protein [Herpetosiphonaceae bacterium]
MRSKSSRVSVLGSASFLVLALVFALVVFTLVSCGQTPAERVLADQRARFDAAQYVAQQQALAPVKTSATRILIGAGAFAGAAVLAAVAVVAGAGAWYALAVAQHKARLIYARDGMLPVPVRELSATIAIASIADEHQTRRAIGAPAVNVPHTLHYAPHVRDALPAPAAAAEDRDDDAPQLPSIVELSRVRDRIQPAHLAYGVLASGELLQLKLGHGYHGLYHGDTGSGKTNAINSMIAQLHHMVAAGVPLQLYAADYKRELSATWSRSALFESGILTEPGEIAEMLGELGGMVRTRYELFEDTSRRYERVVENYSAYASVTGETLPVVICIVDELNAALEASRKNAPLAENLRSLLQIGRGAGVLVQGGFQYMRAENFGRDGSKQFVTRAHFGAYDQTAVAMLFGSKVDHNALQQVIDGTPGRGIIKTVRQPTPQPFQALRCGERDILEAIDLVRDRETEGNMPTFAVAHPKHLETIETVSQQPKSGAILDPEIVKRLRSQPTPLGKKQIIEVLTGAKPGGSTLYTQASREYDQIVAV